MDYLPTINFLDNKNIRMQAAAARSINAALSSRKLAVVKSSSPVRDACGGGGNSKSSATGAVSAVNTVCPFSSRNFDEKKLMKLFEKRHARLLSQTQENIDPVRVSSVREQESENRNLIACCWEEGSNRLQKKTNDVASQSVITGSQFALCELLLQPPRENIPPPHPYADCSSQDNQQDRRVNISGTDIEMKLYGRRLLCPVSEIAASTAVRTDGIITRQHAADKQLLLNMMSQRLFEVTREEFYCRQSLYLCYDEVLYSFMCNVGYNYLGIGTELRSSDSNKAYHELVTMLAKPDKKQRSSSPTANTLHHSPMKSNAGSSMGRSTELVTMNDLFKNHQRIQDQLVATKNRHLRLKKMYLQCTGVENRDVHSDDSEVREEEISDSSLQDPNESANEKTHKNAVFSRKQLVQVNQRLGQEVAALHEKLNTMRWLQSSGYCRSVGALQTAKDTQMEKNKIWQQNIDRLILNEDDLNQSKNAAAKVPVLSGVVLSCLNDEEQRERTIITIDWFRDAQAALQIQMENIIVTHENRQNKRYLMHPIPSIQHMREEHAKNMEEEGKRLVLEAQELMKKATGGETSAPTSPKSPTRNTASPRSRTTRGRFGVVSSPKTIVKSSRAAGRGSGAGSSARGRGKGKEAKKEVTGATRLIAARKELAATQNVLEQLKSWLQDREEKQFQQSCENLQVLENTERILLEQECINNSNQLRREMVEPMLWAERERLQVQIFLSQRKIDFLQVNVHQLAYENNERNLFAAERKTRETILWLEHYTYSNWVKMVKQRLGRAAEAEAKLRRCHEELHQQRLRHKREIALLLEN